MKKTTLYALKLSSAPLVLGIAFASTAALAQSATPAVDCAANPNDASCVEDNRQIVVTGSIVRNPAAATASPVTSITADDLTKRGLSSVADALQTLTANNAGTAPPSWSSFGFATGASTVSLRGLNDAYTLTLFNGMRTAPYPLADDGYRNFVDLNTIPSSIVDRIDVLQDGASATYGSDAIAGVVNVIIKRQITGLHLTGSAGVSGEHDYGEQKLSATFGYGDLDDQGFNVFVNGEYQRNDGLKLSQRGAPFNTADQSTICGSAAQGCLFNGIRNGIQANGKASAFTSTTTPFVRPYTTALGALAPWQLGNPSGGCGDLTSHTLTATELGTLTATQRAAIPANGVVCQQDLVKQYRFYSSPTERKGGTIRGTVKLGDSAEAYAMFNYYNTTTDNFSTPAGYTGQTTPGDVQVTVSQIFLPVYVCAAGTSAIVGNNLVASGCNAGNGTLNPNNPFAAAGNLARLSALPPIPRETFADSKVYRFTAGIHGSVAGWDYALDGTASTATLDRTERGYIFVQGLLDAVAKGTYNFITPSANSAAANQGVFPDSHNHSTSKLTQIQASLNKDLFSLPGGMLNFAIAGQYRYEAIHNPSSNPANANDAARYYSINAVGVDGSRNSWSASYEISAPVLDVLRLKAEGSYDHYSTGQSHFSPKFEAEFKPIPEVKLRGTYSKGFRIPSFSESFALPTTGYVSSNIVCTNATFTAFCAAHASNPAYYAGGYSYGLTSGGNLNLKPETSTGLTAGIVLQPTSRITLTADYYSIKIENLIIGVSASNALVAGYYTNNGVVNIPGITVTQALPDPNNPGALPLLGNIIGSYKNADSFLAKGMDFSASIKLPIGNTVVLTSTASASMLLRLEQRDPDPTIGVSRYDASLGNCNITSCSGAPKWRATWQNTLDFGDTISMTLTASYTSGYSEVATDSGGVYGDCQASTDNGQILGFNDGSPVQCNAKSTFFLDGHIEAKVAPHFGIYMDVKNIMNRHADYEPNAAYGLYQFNPAWQDSLFIGRFFRVGAKVDF